MDEVITKLTCNQCGYELSDDNINCPNCGSKEKHLMVMVKETIHINTCSDIKAKNNKYPSDKKIRYHYKQGTVVSKSTRNGLAEITRIIDKDNDYYYEHVEDYDGNILIHQEEPLSKHQGHGSAKKSNDNSHKPD